MSIKHFKSINFLHEQNRLSFKLLQELCMQVTITRLEKPHPHCWIGKYFALALSVEVYNQVKNPNETCQLQLQPFIVQYVSNKIEMSMNVKLISHFL